MVTHSLKMQKFQIKVFALLIFCLQRRKFQLQRMLNGNQRWSQVTFHKKEFLFSRQHENNSFYSSL